MFQSIPVYFVQGCVGRILAERKRHFAVITANLHAGLLVSKLCFISCLVERCDCDTDQYQYSTK